MKPDFNVMTKAELRSYVLSHREDQEAFQVLADRLPFDDLKQNLPSPQTSFLGVSVEHVSQLADEAFSSAAKDFNK
jgi:hypothetical protein